MFSFDLLTPRTQDFSGLPPLQMGQLGDGALQRQQTDHLPGERWDAHGVERELQFADLGTHEIQAMG